MMNFAHLTFQRKELFWLYSKNSTCVADNLFDEQRSENQTKSTPKKLFKLKGTATRKSV
jgi:hypothetical protein